jgi:hypothetical protein
MKWLKGFGLFWFDFIIGDDWHVAALVAAGLAVTAIAAHAARADAWWLLPVVVFAALAWSLHRATGDQRLPSGADQSGLIGKDDRLDAVAQAQLGQDAADMGLHGRLGDEQAPGDLRVGQPGGHLDEDLTFPLG